MMYNESLSMNAFFMLMCAGVMCDKTKQSKKKKNSNINLL